MYVDFKGLAAHIVSAINDVPSEFYCAVSNCYVDDVSGSLVIRAFTLDDKMVTLTTDKKFYIDDTRYIPDRDKESIKNIISSAGLIRIALKQDGSISKITMPKSGKESKGFRYTLGTSGANDMWYKTTGTLFYSSQTASYGAYAFFGTENTKYIIIPSENKKDESVYRVTDTAHFINDQSYTVEAYSNNDGGYGADIILVYEKGSTTITRNSNIFVVDHTEEAVNSEGNAGVRIVGYENSLPRSYVSEGESVVTTDDMNVTLNPGDIIIPSLNRNGDLVSVLYLYNAKSGRSENESNPASYHASERRYEGIIYDSYKDGFSVISTALPNYRDYLASGDVDGKLNVTTLSKVNIIVYDKNASSGNRVYMGTAAALRPYTLFKDNATKVFVVGRFGVVYEMVVFI